MVVWFVVGLFVLIFLPLGIASFEHFILGSDHFEELCQRVGVYDTLGHIYRPVISFFK